MSIWTCGPDDGNRLGRPRNNDDPGKVPIPPDLTIVQIAIGWKHGHFFTDQNVFYSWGTGTSWRLGTGTKLNLQTPTPISTFPENTQFKQVACGDKFSAVTTQDGQLFVWGSGYAHIPTSVNIPSPVEFIACGQISLLAALADGSVMQFYRHSPPIHHRFPDDRIIAVACGVNHKLALAENGKVYSWGTSHATGQNSTDTPHIIESLANIRIISIFAYHNSSFFIDIQNRIWCCGGNSSGALGVGHTEDVLTPTLQNYYYNNEQIIQIACGDDFTLFLSSQGNVWASGNGGDHRNATESSDAHNLPTLANKLTGHFITQVAAGCFNSAFLENGCPPFNHILQFRGKFQDYPIPLTPFRATTIDRVAVEIRPFQSELLKFGFKLGDIIRFRENEKAKVIGVANESVAVIREEKNQICILNGEDSLDIIRKHSLLVRESAILVNGRTLNGFDIAVDATPEMTLAMAGFLAGDIVQTDLGPETIKGIRIGQLWTETKAPYIFDQNDTIENQDVQHSNNQDIQHSNNQDIQHSNNQDIQHSNNQDIQHSNNQDIQNSNNQDDQNPDNKDDQNSNKTENQKSLIEISSIYSNINDNTIKLRPWNPQDLIIIERNGKNVKQLETLDNGKYVVELIQKDGTLISHPEYGAGILLGTVGKKYCFEFISTRPKVLLTDWKLPISRPISGNIFFEYTNFKHLPILANISSEETSKLGFYVYDRVMILKKKGREYGTVKGVFNGNVVVIRDKQMIDEGKVSLFHPQDLILIGRISCPGIRKFGSLELSVNTDDFRSFKYIPNDRVLVFPNHNNHFSINDIKKAVVVGVKENKLYVLFDKSNDIDNQNNNTQNDNTQNDNTQNDNTQNDNTQNGNTQNNNTQIEDEISRIGIVSEDQLELICRYMEIDGSSERLHVSLMHCGLQRLKPGDVLGIDGKRMIFRGFDQNWQLIFYEKESNFDQICMKKDIFPSFYSPDVF